MIRSLGVVGPPTGHLELTEFLRDHRERYLLAEDTFRRPGRGVVRAVWENLLAGEDESDVELATKLTNGSKQIVNAAGLPVVRRRLRQRLGVFRYVMDEVPRGLPDLDGDRSLLDWIAEHWGLEEEIIATARGLAALARAAAGESTLGWAWISRVLTLRRRPSDHPEYVMPLSLIAAATPPRLGPTGDVRLANWKLWADGPQRLGMLRVLAADLGNQQFFLPACWYLNQLRGMQPHGILAKLRPLESEQSTITRIVSSLEAAQ